MSDNEEESYSEESIVYKPSFVLIAIDTDPSMFVKKENGDSTPFQDCLNACYSLANSLLFTQNRRSWSPFGVVLAREDASASFVDFNEKIPNSIKFLKQKKDLSNDELIDLYQRKGSLDLSAFLLFCKKKFKEVKSAFYKRIIIYITNDDNPVRGDKNQRFAALNEAKNFDANEITFEMVTMTDTFDYKIFYNELFSVVKVPPVETIVEDEEGLIEKLSSLIVVRCYQQRLNFYPFIGDNTRFLKIILKAYIREEKLYNNAYVSKDGKPIKKVPRSVESVIKKFVLANNKEVPIEFDAAENIEIKNNMLHTGYTLVHVSDRVTEVGLVLSNSVILENDHKEDLQYFDSFWQYCVDKNKVLVCARKLRQFDKIRFVELIPKFVNNVKVFITKVIPFNDEQKHPPSDLTSEGDCAVEYSQNKIQVTNDLIENLTFDYHPKMFINPSFAKKKAFLRSKFLDEPQEDVEDVTLDRAGIDKSLGEVGESFKKLFHLDEEPVKKRKAPAARQNPKKKK